MWNFTPRSVRRLPEDFFGEANTEVEGHGDVLAAVAFLHGPAVEDLDPARLRPADPGCELCITARAVR